jgi:hypothetical protein
MGYSVSPMSCQQTVTDVLSVGTSLTGNRFHLSDARITCHPIDRSSSTELLCDGLLINHVVLATPPFSFADLAGLVRLLPDFGEVLSWYPLQTGGRFICGSRG